MTDTPGKTTPLPWRADCGQAFADREGDTDIEIFAAHGWAPEFYAEADANIALAVTAANGCHAVSPGNEMAVAEGIEEAFKLLKVLATEPGSHRRIASHARDLLSRLNVSEGGA